MNSISSYDELSTSPNGSMEYIADEIDEDKPKNIIAWMAKSCVTIRSRLAGGKKLR